MHCNVYCAVLCALQCEMCSALYTALCTAILTVHYKAGSTVQVAQCCLRWTGQCSKYRNATRAVQYFSVHSAVHHLGEQATAVQRCVECTVQSVQCRSLKQCRLHNYSEMHCSALWCAGCPLRNFLITPALHTAWGGGRCSFGGWW